MPLAIQRFNAAKLHCYNYIFKRFWEATERAPNDLKQILRQLLVLYGLHSISENAGWFLQYGYLTSAHMATMRSKMLELLDAIRPQAIPLTDAFGLSDYVINSPLGCADGDVYRRIFDKTRATNPPKPHAYFERVIKPVLNADNSDK